MTSPAAPDLGDVRGAQKAFEKSLQKGGMLPCELQGIGLVLLIATVGCLIAAIAVFALGGPTLLALLLLVDAGVANIMNSLRSKRWLRAQPGWPTEPAVLS